MTTTKEQNRVEDLIGLRVIQQTINPNVLQNYAALRQKSSRRLVVRGIITILGLDDRLV